MSRSTLQLPERCRPLAVVLPLLLAVLACSGSPRPRLAPSEPPEPGEPRILFFALDAVPYSLVERLAAPEAEGGEGLFSGFHEPVPLVSSFPATSSVAFTGLLEPFELPRPPGYEARFFDRDVNRVRGGSLFSYHKIPFGWRQFFTWSYGNVVKRTLATATPVKSSLKEIEAGLEAFVASDAERFFAYAAMTDGAAHMKGPESLESTMRALDEGLARLRRERPDLRFHTVIYSDHGIAGGEPLDNVRGSVKEALRAAGFDLGERLEAADDAVIVPFGLVSSFEVYTRAGRGPDVASALGEVEGVDLCAAPLGPDRWQVSGAGGDAVFERRDGPGGLAWSYRPESGDPLGYAPLAARFAGAIARGGGGSRLRSALGLDHGSAAGETGAAPGPDGTAAFFPDRWWFEATVEHRYPDAFHRLARTFDLVENTASVACSVAEGHVYGALTTELAARLSIGKLRWTHGSLRRDGSMGFLMTDLPGYEPPEAVRFDRALVPFTDD